MIRTADGICFAGDGTTVSGFDIRTGKPGSVSDVFYAGLITRVLLVADQLGFSLQPPTPEDTRDHLIDRFASFSTQRLGRVVLADEEVPAVLGMTRGALERMLSGDRPAIIDRTFKGVAPLELCDLIESLVQYEAGVA